MDDDSAQTVNDLVHLRAAVLAAAAALTVLVSAGGCSSSSVVHGLGGYLDGLPLPAGTVPVSSATHDAGGDSTPEVQRDYRCPLQARCGAALMAALRAKHWQGVRAPAGGVDNAVLDTTAPAGSVYALPPGRKGSGIQLSWNVQGGISALARDGAVDDQ